MSKMQNTVTDETRKSLEIYKNYKSTYNLSISKEQLDLLKNGKYTETILRRSEDTEHYLGMNARYVLIDIEFDKLQQKLNNKE